MNERERFEKWFRDNIEGVKVLPRSQDGMYSYWVVETAWRAWQDRAPEGWKLVPVEPTEGMMDAGDNAIRNGLEKASINCPYGLHPEHASYDVYGPMLQAAPEPE